MDEAYKPVACELHSEYELLAMHRSRVSLHTLDNQGMALQLQCHVMDIRTSEGAEYLIVTDDSNTTHQFRLDKIQSIKKINS